jgi:hypothetical protein
MVASQNSLFPHRVLFPLSLLEAQEVGPAERAVPPADECLVAAYGDADEEEDEDEPEEEEDDLDAEDDEDDYEEDEDEDDVDDDVIIEDDDDEDQEEDEDDDELEDDEDDNDEQEDDSHFVRRIMTSGASCPSNLLRSRYFPAVRR